MRYQQRGITLTHIVTPHTRVIGWLSYQTFSGHLICLSHSIGYAILVCWCFKAVRTCTLHSCQWIHTGKLFILDEYNKINKLDSSRCCVIVYCSHCHCHDCQYLLLWFCLYTWESLCISSLQNILKTIHWYLYPVLDLFKKVH